jgi:uncharacterized protein YcfL
MKNLLLSLSIILVCCISCNAQPQVKTIVNDGNAEKRSVTAFTGIEVSNAITVYVSQGNEDAVAVSCSDADKTKKIITEVKDGILNIYMERSFWSNSNFKAKAYVSIKNIQKLQASGASTIKITEGITCNNLDIKASGASGIKGTINCDKINMQASGASTVNIEGSCNNAQLKASGASDIKGFNFIIKNGKIDASGASNVGVTVNGELTAEASGASDIKYAGNPTNTNVNSTGASSIKKKG